MTKERELANKISEYWYKELHGQIAPIFQKQKLANFVENELQKLNIPDVIKSVCEHVYEEVEHGYGNTCLRCKKCGKITD